MAGESWIAWRKMCPSVILSLKIAPQSELALNLAGPAEKLAAKHLKYGTAFVLLI